MQPERLVLLSWFPRDPSRPHGGVEAVTVILAETLARTSPYDVHVITLDPDVVQPIVSEWHDVTIHRLPRHKGSLLGQVSGKAGRVIADYALRLKPTLLHAHDTFGLITRGLAIPRVFTIHGFIHEDTRYRGRVSDHLRAFLWKHHEHATWAEQPHIISISPYVRERLRGIAHGMIHDVENPIDERCFGVERMESGLRVFSAAVISPRKNTLALVEAFARAELPDAQLRLAGPITHPEYGESVRAYIRHHGLEQRVHLLGSLPSSGIRDELARASLFALVSLEEGAPMGVAEAMAAGVPILTSNRCGMPYMVRHGESGFLVDPTSSADVARHLRLLLTDSVLRQHMRQGARASAERMFHPNSVAARTLRVYERAKASS